MSDNVFYTIAGMLLGLLCVGPALLAGLLPAFAGWLVRRKAERRDYRPVRMRLDVSADDEERAQSIVSVVARMKTELLRAAHRNTFSDN